MKTEIDPDRCCGFGECIAVAPDLFVMGADNRAHVVGDGGISAEDQNRARSAALACPVEAIRVIE